MTQSRCRLGREATLTKELNVHFLEGVGTAELVELMVDLIKDEGLVIIGSEVPHNVVDWGGRNRGGQVRKTEHTPNGTYFT